MKLTLEQIEGIEFDSKVTALLIIQKAKFFIAKTEAFIEEARLEALKATQDSEKTKEKE